MTGARRVVVDACVLFPPVVRSLVLGLAETGAFVPLVSVRILEEWRLAVAARHGLATEAVVLDETRRLGARFPDACVDVPEDMPPVMLPDPADEHVVHAALAGGADAILTFNIRDFPRRRLAGLGLEVQHPDGFLWQALSHDPAVAILVSGLLVEAGIVPDRARAALKRAHLSRFAKAYEAMAERPA